MDKYTGKRLGGHYEVHELIGVGGMTLVYRAYGQIDDHTVATKTLKDEFLGNEDLIRRFKDESKTIAVPPHSSIVKVHGVSFGDRIQYIVMEYIDGIILREYLDQQEEIRWKEAIRFTMQILYALQHAHEKDIIHRDIKPQNIILPQDGTTKVTDFDTARFSRNETHTMTGKIIGSIHYIASEQVRGGLTGEKAGIYPVGVMLYEMITGQLPFKTDNVASVAIMQLQADPRPSKDIDPAISDGLEEITLKAMQRSPSQQYQSVVEILRDTEQFRRNPSISFQYKYFINEKPIKYVDVVDAVRRTGVANYNDNYVYKEEYSRGKEKKKFTTTLMTSGVLTVFLLAAVVFGIMTLTRSRSVQEAEDVDLLSLVGQKFFDIQADEKYKEFQLRTGCAKGSGKDSGIVPGQNPEGTKKVKANAEITLTTNGESRTVTIPPVKGLTQVEAEGKLKVLNLQYEAYQVEDDQTATGYMKDVVPAKGSRVAQSGTVVKLYASKGPFSIEVSVPSIIGKNLDTMRTDILAVGLTVDAETAYVDDNDKAEGVVIEASPLPGVKVTKGTPVKISISSGRKSEKTIDIYVQLSSQVMHDVMLRTYLDGILYSEETVNPPYNSAYQMSFKGTSSQKTLIIQLDGQKYNTFLLDFDAGTPRQIESYMYQESEGSSASEIMRTP